MTTPDDPATAEPEAGDGATGARLRSGAPDLSGTFHQPVQIGDTRVDTIAGPAAVGPGAQLLYEHHEHLAAPVILQSLHALPAAPADFTGRQVELEDLRAHLGGAGAIVAIQGLGGVGKTSLALRLAHQVRDLYPDAQFLIDLKGILPKDTHESPLPASEAMRQVIRAVQGVKADLPDNQSELADRYRSVLDGQRALLVLDNAREADQVLPLLPPPSCGVVLTSRGHFPLPGLYARDLGALPEAEAIQLVQRISPRVGEQASALVKACGSLPLALRVTASALARRASLPVEDYLLRLNVTRRQDELAPVRASLAASGDSLSDDLKAVFAQLGIFPASFDRRAAVAVCDAESSVDVIQDALDSLVDVSLVAWDAERARYQLHDLVREEALARLSADVLWSASFRHATHYARIAREAADLYLQGGDFMASGLALFDREWAHLQAGQAWAVAQGRDPDAARLVLDYAEGGQACLVLRLPARRQIDWFRPAAEAARALGEPHREGPALGNLGAAYAALGEWPSAMGFFEQHLELARRIGDGRGAGIALGNLGAAHAAQGDLAGAILFYEQRLAQARMDDDRHGEGLTLGNLGQVYEDQGDPGQALALYQRQLEIARELNDRRGEATALGNLGRLIAEHAELSQALELFEQQLAIARELNDRRGEAVALGHLGQAWVHLDQPHQALPLHEKQLALAQELGQRRLEANALGQLGLAYAALGDPGRAITYFERQLTIVRRIGDRLSEGRALGNLGIRYADLGDLPRAIERYNQRLAVAREIGDRQGEMTALGNLGSAQAALGQAGLAVPSFEQQHAIARQIGDRGQEARAAWYLGEALAALGQPQRAADYMQASVDFARAIGAPDADQGQAIVDALRRQAG